MICLQHLHPALDVSLESTTAFGLVTRPSKTKGKTQFARADEHQLGTSLDSPAYGAPKRSLGSYSHSTRRYFCSVLRHSHIDFTFATCRRWADDAGQ